MEEKTQDIDFDKIFKTMVFAMKLNRSHPDIPRDKKWVCQFFLMHATFFLIFCLFIYNIIFFDIRKGDLTQACANGIPIVVFTVITLKYCVMLRYQNNMKSLIDEMKIDYAKSKSYSTSEQRLMRNYAQRGKKVVMFWLIISSACGILFVFKSVFLMIYYSVKGDFKLVSLYDLTYPSPIEEHKNDPIVYCILYIMLLYFLVYAIVMYIAMAALGPIYMLHGCGQLELVTFRIMEVFNKNDSEKTTLQKLCVIVNKLQKIYSFVHRIQESFKVMYEMTLKATAIILPIIFFQIIQSYKDGDLRIEFISISIGGVALVSIPCYYSDQLMDMGENVRQSVYMCGWEMHLERHRVFRTMLLIIHARAARTVAIRTMFRNVSLDALTDVYHQSYAIFNVLNASSH